MGWFSGLGAGRGALWALRISPQARPALVKSPNGWLTEMTMGGPGNWGPVASRHGIPRAADRTAKPSLPASCWAVSALQVFADNVQSIIVACWR